MTEREERRQLEMKRGAEVCARHERVQIFRDHIKDSVAPNHTLLEWIALAEEAGVK